MLNKILDQKQSVARATDSYQRDGFMVLKDFIKPSICDFLKIRMNTLINQADLSELRTVFSTKSQAHAQQQYFLDSGDKIRFFLEEGAFNDEGELRTDPALCINKIGHALHELDPAFNCFSNLHQFAILMQDLDIADPRIVQSMYICKQPYFGGEVTPHQDSTYLFVKEKPVTGFWLALEDATMQNGCLWAIPGGHQSGLKSRMKRDKNDHVSTEIYDDTPWDAKEMIPLEVTKGSLIVIHGLLPHMSKENVSEKSRHAYAMHVVSGKYEFDKENWLRRSDG